MISYMEKFRGKNTLKIKKIKKKIQDRLLISPRRLTMPPLQIWKEKESQLQWELEVGGSNPTGFRQ